jgi:hypothetical protein
MKKVIILYSFFLLSSCCLLSKKTKPQFIGLGDPSFIVEKDGVVFSFKNTSKIGFNNDSEKFFPVTFKTELPLGILHFNYFNASQFSFIFPCEEGIFMATNLGKNIQPQLDTTIIVSKNEMKNLIEDEVGIRGLESVRQIHLSKNRLNYLIYQNGVKIFLVNIKKQNINKYFKRVYKISIIE